MPLEYTARSRVRPQDGERLWTLALPVRIENVQSSQTLVEEAKVDTGAESTVASCDSGRAIGLDFSGPRDTSVKPAVGSPVPGWIRKVRLHLHAENGHQASWISSIVFVEQDLPGVLLGWAGALNYFRVSVDLPTFTLRPIDPGFPGRHTCGTGPPADVHDT